MSTSSELQASQWTPGNFWEQTLPPVIAWSLTQNVNLIKLNVTRTPDIKAEMPANTSFANCSKSEVSIGVSDVIDVGQADVSDIICHWLLNIPLIPRPTD